MFTDKELKGTINYINRKTEDILDDEKGSDADYIHDLQTLAKLKDAARNSLERRRVADGET